MSQEHLRATQAELRAQLEGAKAKAPPPPPFALEELPRVDRNLLIQAASVRGHFPVEYVPVSSIVTVRTTDRAVGCYLRNGRWLCLWVGDSPEKRDEALAAVLSELGRTKRW
jgi:hypothetical protein